MKTGHLIIGKKITLITEHTVQDFNMNLFDSIIQNFDVITLVGLTKPLKKENYSNILLDNNFIISKINLYRHLKTKKHMQLMEVETSTTEEHN